MAFQKAQKFQHKLRIGLAGPTGSGKTYTALRLAATIAAREGKRVAVIDTEHGTASLYANTFDFDVMELTSFAPDRYVEAISEAARSGEYSVLVVDSFTHAWSGKDGALEQVDRKAGGAGGSFNAWRDVTPQHTRLVEAMLSCPIHLIGTLRSKMAYEVDTDPKTKRVSVRKIGLQPIQREGMEYEFDVFADLDVDNTLTVSKTRNAELAGYSVQKAGEDLGVKLWEWAQGGDAAPEKPVAPPVAAETPQQAARPTYTREQQLAGLGEDNGTIGKRFAEYMGEKTCTVAMLGLVVPPHDKGGVNIGAWLTAHPDKTLRDLVSAALDAQRTRDEESAIDDGMAALADAAAREEAQQPALT